MKSLNEEQMRKIYSKKENDSKQNNLITTYFKKKIYGYDPLRNTWHCFECGLDMGSSNPRQLCGKYKCNNSPNF